MAIGERDHFLASHVDPFVHLNILISVLSNFMFQFHVSRVMTIMYSRLIGLNSR